MQDTSHAIVALLGSRICHDLVSPIGAISNGVELLQMAGGGNGPELELIQESVDNANARIRFFRIAFGIASEDQRVSASEIREVLADLTRGSRLDIQWGAEGDLPRVAVKHAFLMIQCLEHAMPRGGQITVSKSGESWTIQGQSDRMKELDPLWQVLRGDGGLEDLSAAQVQFAILPMILGAAGKKVTLDVSETVVTASF